MDDQERAEIIAEVLRERMASVRHIIDEWSVPQSDAVNYAQIKDLIWQIAAPLGLSLIGFSTVEQALHEYPGDIDALGNRALFAQAGEETGALLEQFLEMAGLLR